MSETTGAQWDVFELGDGKVVRLETFATREKAIESVAAAGAEQHDRVG